MKKEIINKAILNEDGEVEIFCKKKYRGYYVRGTIFQLQDGFRNEGEETFCVYVYYRLALTVLVNASFQARTRQQRNNWGIFLGLDGLTEEEYLKTERREYLDLLRKEPEAHILDGDSAKETLEHHMKNRTLLIDMDEADIKETEYLNESIRAEKDTILLNVDFVFNKIKIRSPQAKKRNYLDRIYITPAFHCPERGDDPADDFMAFFEQNFEIPYFKLKYNYLEKREYYMILDSIGGLSYEWIKKNAMNKRYLKKLNRLVNKIGDRTYPLTNFCWKFLDDLVDDLMTQKQIRECQFCGDFFAYNPRVAHKKFCSLRSERKDCGKKAGYRRWYEKHKSENRAKSRKEMRETRALYTRKGL